MLSSPPNTSQLTPTYNHTKFVTAAQQYLNYVYDTRFIDPAKSKLHAYLKRGISPDIYVISPVSGQLLTLLACSIEMNNIYIVRYLLEHGADPLKPVSPTELRTPLHWINEKIKKNFYLTYRNDSFSREMYQVIFAFVKNTEPKFCLGLERDLRSAFFILHQRILKEMSLAKIQGKKLLIMMSETHESTLEALLNAMIIEICIRLKISNLMIEQTEKYLKHFLEACNTQQPYEDPYLLDQIWAPAIGNHLYGYQHAMKIIPIDVQRDPNNPYWNTSPEGISIRENAMVEQMMNHDEEHGFCTVGLAHMGRLVQNRRIENTFHIFPINAAFTPLSDPHFTFAYSSNVFQISELFDTEFINKVNSLLAPVIGLDIVANVAKNLRLEEGLAISSSQESDDEESLNSGNRKQIRKHMI